MSTYGLCGVTLFGRPSLAPDVKGFPDLVIVGPDRVLFRELKSQKGKVTGEQGQWLASLNRAGQDAEVWRPDQWDDIQAELMQVAGR